MPPELEHADVFTAGADNVHTYRIPSLIVAPGGALLAFCEARKTSTRDACPTDMVLKRSEDGGRTWGAMQTLVRGEGEEAIMNPTAVVDGGEVLLFCINAHKDGPRHHRHLLLRSADDGRTWSGPAKLADEMKPCVDTFVPGPGVGVRMRSGRIVVPGNSSVLDDAGERTASFSRAAYSDDGGRSWRIGEVVDYPWSNESQAVERNDGSLMINFRIQKGDDEHPGCRGTAVSRDGGETWGEPTLARALNEARCQAGFVRCAPPQEGGDERLLFSNPDARPGPEGGARTKMTVRLSPDEGRTWPASRLIHPGPSVYSCPAVLPDGAAGLLYECGDTEKYERIRFARFSMDWLAEGRDSGVLCRQGEGQEHGRHPPSAAKYR